MSLAPLARKRPFRSRLVRVFSLGLLASGATWYTHYYLARNDYWFDMGLGTIEFLNGEFGKPNPPGYLTPDLDRLKSDFKYRQFVETVNFELQKRLVPGQYYYVWTSGNLIHGRGWPIVSRPPRFEICVLDLSETPRIKQAQQDFAVVPDGGADVRYGPIFINWILFFLAGMVLIRLPTYAKFKIGTTGNE